MADVRRMQSNFHSNTIYFWSQELTLHGLCSQTLSDCSSSDHWAVALQKSGDENIGLPLLLPTNSDCVGFVRGVAGQRSMRPQGVPAHHE